MKSVILVRDLRSLKKYLPRPSERIRFLVLNETRESSDIRAYLKRQNQTEELPRTHLFREGSTKFQARYVEGLGRLNVLSASRDWWTLPFTNKNPISTTLCRETCYFFMIVELVHQFDDVLIIVAESQALGSQVEAWCRAKGIKSFNAIKARWTLRLIVQRVPFLMILLLMVRMLWLKCWMGRSRLSSNKDTQPSTMVLTLVHPHSFQTNGQFRNLYMGRLAEWLVDQGLSVIEAGLVQGQSVALTRGLSIEHVAGWTLAAGRDVKRRPDLSLRMGGCPIVAKSLARSYSQVVNRRIVSPNFIEECD